VRVLSYNHEFKATDGATLVPLVNIVL